MRIIKQYLDISITEWWIQGNDIRNVQAIKRGGRVFKRTLTVNGLLFAAF